MSIEEDRLRVAALIHYDFRTPNNSKHRRLGQVFYFIIKEGEVVVQAFWVAAGQALVAGEARVWGAVKAEGAKQAIPTGVAGSGERSPYSLE